MSTPTETLTSLLKLPSEVLRLRLASANLAMTGSKRDQAVRLHDHLRQNPPTGQPRSRRTSRRHATPIPTPPQAQINVSEEESGGGTDLNGSNSNSNSNSSDSGSSLEDEDRAVHCRAGRQSSRSPTGGAERRETEPVRPPRSERPHAHQNSRRGHRSPLSPLRRHSGRSRSSL